jgi:predicted amidohydrolase YtcJ
VSCTRVQLEGLLNIVELNDRLMERARTVPLGGWIRAVGYDTAPADTQMLERRALDQVAPDHPGYVPLACMTPICRRLSVIR